ncbi:conserved hypothetical protein [Talaromyces stipitatus ATCC 10500]|uniref:Integral membrane protein n=1 Tax=Talaromyces stipitatus (strain ATCC 10500 / CBS 375.48 / QM 6759 / NRRL 1006) TaxID=441959 RepID=B8MJV2_TALSN|nr:uncharacterized protein TSTA_042440 [Talaromyces stipitatus ATCC 10500]EED14769.1 conserved hypothetical protein [Talaromyces stipitatus ATCC 10500]
MGVPDSEKVTRPTEPDALVLEAWGQGLLVGALLVMFAITIANMRRRVLLHKLILAELFLAMFHGTWIFTHEPAYGWYLSVTAIGLNVSWSLHNVIAWMKNRPFLSCRVSAFYITTVILVQPYWVLEIYANFTYFNNINKIFIKTRPLEPLFRDPWWLFTTCSLFYVIKKQYDFSLFELIKVSPRFGVMLLSMCLSLAFTVFDILSVTNVFSSALPTGVEPFWKLSFIFKCLCDTVILDDFKTALDRMHNYWLRRMDPNLEIGPDEYTFSSMNPQSYRDGRRKSSLRDIEEETATLGLSVMNPAAKYATQPNSKTSVDTAEKQILQQQRTGSFAHLNYVNTPQSTKRVPVPVQVKTKESRSWYDV